MAEAVDEIVRIFALTRVIKGKPAMFSHVATIAPPADMVGPEKQRFLTVRNALVRQTGYGYTAKTPH
ncbi:Hypothetical protein RG1141_PA07760 (plasmid) [Neorhizobium galegae bv. officinalis bv. officinalis str. HAMBI 1141]|uniref:Uncharacterized protein n=1 Tax=Neorhizobium galegae bv. officinalis bv. officinalis str. HAMBI 1141 TaxID=1028801 RepID=A0A068TGV6_NEOGA|nr:hypothetical protein [Neorhizobium galegae]CDN57608.1 Hypothetical protein RG1141_PA07760 [Neorhizobium galegae bv. officinalis bv. officinalis str. HAMBI 1141]